MYFSTTVNVTLKDPIERGLKAQYGKLSTCAITPVTLKDPIERGLKEYDGMARGNRPAMVVTLKDPIERGLKVI